MGRSPGNVCTDQRDILVKKGDKAKAEEEYTKAIVGYRKEATEGGPKALAAKYHLAHFFVGHKRNLDEAVRYAEELAAADPPQATYFILSARCYEAAGRTKDALAAIDRALELDPQRAPHFRQYRDRLAKPGGPPRPPAPSGGPK